MKLLAMLFLLFVPTFVHAQAVEAIPPGEDVIEAIQKGSPAPFSGQLFDTMTAMRWGNWLQQYKLRLDVDVKAVERMCKVEMDYQLSLKNIEVERNKRIEEDLRSRLVVSETRNVKLADRINNPSFFRSMEFGVTLGVVGSAVVAVAVGLVAAK